MDKQFTPDDISITKEEDLLDASYTVYSSKRRVVCFGIAGNKLTLHCQDFGPECRVMNDSDEYEFFYTLDEDGTRRFLTNLRIEYGQEDPLPEILKNAYGSDDGPKLFIEFCEKNDIKHRFFSW